MRRYGFVLVILWVTLFSQYLFAETQTGIRRTFEYWDNGNYKSSALYDSNGRVRAKAYCTAEGTVEKIEKFDIYGNRVQEAFYDEKGRLKTGIDGWAAMRWWYDGSSLISQISYSEDGKPLERKEYSESGKLVFRQYNMDEMLNPYEEATMSMMLGGRNIAYYDSNGRLRERAGIIME